MLHAVLYYAVIMGILIHNLLLIFTKELQHFLFNHFEGLDCSCVLMPIYLIIICFRGFDDEMRAVVARNLEGRGINLHPRTNLTEVFY